jgi:myosin-1
MFIALSWLGVSTNTVKTNRHVYLVAQSIVNNQLVISSERTIPIGAIKAVSTSNLKDDWFSLIIGAQDPDPLLTCVFKTEFFTHLSNALRGSLNLKIGER